MITTSGQGDLLTQYTNYTKQNPDIFNRNQHRFDRQEFHGGMYWPKEYLYVLDQFEQWNAADQEGNKEAARSWFEHAHNYAVSHFYTANLLSDEDYFEWSNESITIPLNSLANFWRKQVKDVAEANGISIEPGQPLPITQKDEAEMDLEFVKEYIKFIANAFMDLKNRVGDEVPEDYKFANEEVMTALTLETGLIGMKDD